MHSERERKHACRYRKSCYETGVLPDLTIPVDHDVVVEEEGGVVIDLESTNKLAIKIACKYRTSCYETGVLPEQLFVKREVEEEELEDKPPKYAPDQLLALEEKERKVACKYQPRF